MKSMHKLRRANSPFPFKQPDDDDHNDNNDYDSDVANDDGNDDFSHNVNVNVSYNDEIWVEKGPFVVFYH